MHLLKSFVFFVADPLMAVVGFTMFCFPMVWAKSNARFSQNTFDSPAQLKHTKRLGLLMMILAVFSLVSMLSVTALMRQLK